MTYDAWKLSNPDDERWEDPADQCTECGDHYTRCVCESGYEDADPTCMHGNDLFARCDECEEIKAANGGEGDDMDPDKLMESSALSLEQQQQIVNDWIDAAPARELKRIKIRVELVVEQRRAELARETKELEQFEKPVRATRSDAGKPRERRAAS